MKKDTLYLKIHLDLNISKELFLCPRILKKIETGQVTSDIFAKIFVEELEAKYLNFRPFNQYGSDLVFIAEGRQIPESVNLINDPIQNQGSCGSCPVCDHKVESLNHDIVNVGYAPDYYLLKNSY